MKLLPVLIISLFILSCSSSKKEEQAPSGQSDNDRGVVTDNSSDEDNKKTVNDVEKKEDLDNTSDDQDNKKVDNEEESDIEDEATDDDEGGIPPADGDPYAHCKVNIPYKYYGDVNIVAEDPENIREDLWGSFYDKIKKEEKPCVPNEYDVCADKYPYEPALVCVHPQSGTSTSMDDTILEFPYDYVLTPSKFQIDNLVPIVYFKQKNGKLLISMSGFSREAAGAYLYDIEKKQVIKYGRYFYDGTWNGRYIVGTTADFGYNRLDEDDPNFNREQEIIYYDTKLSKYGYAYPKNTHLLSATYTRMSDTHIVTSVFLKPETKARVFYTRIGEWDKWKELTYKVDTKNTGAGKGQLIGQYFTWFTDNLEIAYCDLEKGDDGCFTVSRPGNKARYVKMNDRNTLYYDIEDSGTEKGSIMIKADVSDPKNIKYAELFKYNWILSAQDVNDDYLLYGKVTGDDGYRFMHSICYYRFKDKKQFCLEDEKDATVDKLHAVMWKHYLVYENNTDVIIRNMKEYCEHHPDRCPFEEFTKKK